MRLEFVMRGCELLRLPTAVMQRFAREPLFNYLALVIFATFVID